VGEERKRLYLTQEELGARGGVRQQSQYLYEKGERKPDSGYLAAVAAAGVDVLYVVTGVRSQPLPPDNELPEDEKALLTAYRVHRQHVCVRQVPARPPQ